MSNLVKAYISRAALRHNVEVLKAAAAGTPLCAIVKANAYGHGAVLVAEALSGMGIAFWGVATIAEALELRKHGIREPILLLRPLELYEPVSDAAEASDALLEADIRPTIVGAEGIRLLAQRAAYRRIIPRVHLKVDTGMGRSGCPADDAVELALLLRASPFLELEGIYSHFACADERVLDFTRRQQAVFQDVLEKLATRGVRIPIRHLANSAAIFNLPEARLDMVRPGLALYGYGGKYIRGSERLRPSLRLEAPVITTKWIPTGETCGYGRIFTARRKTRIGLLPLGYADGYNRRWSNAGQVSFGNQLIPVIGRVSMDLTILDLTDAPDAVVGSPVCVVSDRRDDPHSVESMAERLDTIPHEITCALGSRVERVLTA
ncbi:MAG: alanine racemase [Verrucomicrobia bacterium]|nr:alanine racemase [Verrucomicrobiota bacterium]MBU1736257.1 alanine racemase [Verrucomicrobiota bacterium]MBU1857655.1 alanine racemase [Verrucomicrobiota bacterium]